MALGSNRFAIYIAIGRLITMAASFLMPVVLVRFMSQSDYGVLSQFLTLYGAIYVIAALGIHSNLFFFYPTSSKEKTDKYVSNTLVLLFLFGLFAGIIIIIPPIQHALFGNSELGAFKELIIVCIIFATPMNIVSPINTVREDKWGAMLLPGIIAIIRIATVILCAIIYNDLHQLFKWLVIYQLLIFIIVIIYSMRKVRFRLDWQLAKKQLAYSIPFGFAVALQLFSNYFDKFVCIKFLTAKEYAIYAVAFLSIPGVTQVYDSLCQVNIVNMTKSYRTGHVEEIAPQYQNFVIKTLSFSVPLIFAVAVFSEEIMSFLYTDSYAASAPYFRLYSLTFLLSMIGAGTILRATGKTKESLLAFVISCAIGLPVTYFLVKYYNTEGAIWGAMINILLPRLIQMIMEMQVLRLSIVKFLPWKEIAIIILPAIALSAILLILKYTICNGIISCIIFCFVFVIILYSIYLQANTFIINKSQFISFIHKFHIKK